MAPELTAAYRTIATPAHWRGFIHAPKGTDVFDVQAAVAARVADKLGVVLSPPAQTQLAARPTQNLAAYDAYLQSIALAGTDPPTVRRSLAAAEQAVALDSGFAAAWARVATRHTLLYGNAIPTRAGADTARVAFEAQLRAAPDDFQRHQFHGLALAYLGQRAAAVREGERGLALAEATGNQDVYIAYARKVMARTYVLACDHPRAVSQLDSLLATPYFISPAWLRIDPSWAPLRGDPHFEQLLTPPTTSSEP